MNANEQELKQLQAQMKRALEIKANADERLRVLNRKIASLQNNKILIT